MSSSTPSIRVSQHQRHHSPPPYPSFAAATAMAITREGPSAPPPLPPPTHMAELSPARDIGWQWGNDPNSSDFGRPASVKPGSSLLGNPFRSPRLEKEQANTTHHDYNDSRRGSSISTITPIARDQDMMDDSLAHGDDDGPSSKPSSNYRLQSEKRLEQTSLGKSSHDYDKQLLSRIGGPNTPKRQSVSYSSGNAQETAQLANAESERRNSQLRPLSMPDRQRHLSDGSMDSPVSARWPQSIASSGAVSPGFNGFWEQGPQDGSRAQTRHGSIAFDDSSSQRGSYDHSMFVHDTFPMEESQMNSLNIHDRSPGSEDPKAGSKRRASSPSRDAVREDRTSVSSASGHNDLYHRRSMQQLPNRASPVSRFHPNHSSISSASSFAPRHGSLGSSLGVASISSSATSYGSGRVSPNGLSPATMDPDLGAGTPYGNVKALIPSPVASDPRHQGTFSESTQSGRKIPSGSIAHSRQNSMSQMQGVYICECCPKKPKKYDTEEELRLHESEKQYTCAYCSNRFKNKNEAERHQNSLHLRRHSWSCAALAGVEAAFHASMSANGTDECGYCGEQFPSPPQWEARADHLNHVHKFGECNQAKKFFRADHFRQHLKHSHAGTSGKWTNMLEIACMKDEPPPEKRVSVTLGTPGGQAPPALMVTTTGLPRPLQGAARLVAQTSRNS